ncbi:hypothetical protein BA895_17130 [Humibacillus sp. DSM 29435]|uniref:hypothetical protein n=1 Tax=Humibacillus sp. DSM 29435 TaxID=1869167 RepID=UPI000872D113|nr:hypothetical protein [Humibacillus sp. DSM 29435]OFE17186.1 hypothetical protein BA895_17130 [Humibacillus sp. DSM 29435]
MEDEKSPALRAGVDFRGTQNATMRVSEHVRPGRKRAPLLRYVRFNLPRATRLLLLFVVAVIGAASAAVALSDREPFAFAAPVLWAVCGVAVVFVAVGLLTSARIWAWGAALAVASLLVYLGGLAGDAPYVWNGASIVLAATWNVTLLASIGYLVLYSALRYGIIVAAPDDQNFMD